MDSADVIDTKKFQEGFSLGRKSKLSKAADEDSSKATSSFEGRKMERSHTFTDELDSHSGNSYDPKKELMNELKKEDFYPQKNLSTSPSLTTINTKDTASPNLKPNGKDNPACLLNGDDDFSKEEIFLRLCPKSKYKDSEGCFICKTKFNILLKKRRHCKFCGESICDDHSKKTRPDPETPGSYVKICDVCDRKYIQRLIQEEFKTKVDKIDEEIQIYDQQLAKALDTLKKKQQTYDNQLSEKNRRDKEYNERITNLIQKTSYVRDDIKRVEKENMILNEKYTSLQKENAELEKKMNELDLQDRQQEKEGDELTHKLNALDQDIAQMSKTLRGYDRTALHKIRNNEDGKNRETSYFAKADVMDAAMDSLVSRLSDSRFVDSRVETTPPKKHKISPRRFPKNQKADPGTCNTGCKIF